ncbi:MULTISPECIES: hypothetical protein [Staphylococcus]|uniref:hypothetical protein n=1 Tax=Staphylococcus TaxID=1279 RepID=UPI00344DE6C1
MENKNILNLISFTNYDNVEINENLKSEIINNIDLTGYEVEDYDEVETYLLKNRESFFNWLLIGDQEDFTIKDLIRAGFKSPNKSFNDLINEQFIDHDERVKLLNNGMILFTYE